MDGWIAAQEAAVQQLKMELAERRKTLPAHSVRVHQLAALEELEERLRLAERRLERASACTDALGWGVEFICTGNICRSPFAEGYAVSLGLPPGSVTSSGLWADDGRCCPERAVATASEFGVDLLHHYAGRTSGGDLSRRSWVLVMEHKQLRQVQRMLPRRWAGRLALLGEYLGEGNEEIPDPYGRSAETYRRAYRMTVAAVEKWSNGLLQPRVAGAVP